MYVKIVYEMLFVYHKLGHVVVQSVEALRGKLEGRSFNSG